MPYMFSEQPQKAAQIALGDVTVETTPVTAGTQKTFRGDRNSANLVLPAGAYSVYLRHADPTGGEITVNGEPIKLGGNFTKEAQTDQVNLKQDFVPEITISNPGEKTFWLDVAYPSSSSFNPAVI